jgi:hypothetical protein
VQKCKENREELVKEKGELSRSRVGVEENGGGLEGQAEKERTSTRYEEESKAGWEEFKEQEEGEHPAGLPIKHDKKRVEKSISSSSWRDGRAWKKRGKRSKKSPKKGK